MAKLEETTFDPQIHAITFTIYRCRECKGVITKDEYALFKKTGKCDFCSQEV